MIEKLKKVYYCEYCKKKSMQKASMVAHEARCTMNPGRWCKMCENAGDYPELAARFAEFCSKYPNPFGSLEYEESETDAKLLELAQGCPACALAVARQSKTDVYFEFADRGRAYLAEHRPPPICEYDY